MQPGATTSLRARHATGQDSAIDDVYAALSPMVLGYLRRFVPHDEAEDVLQRVFYEVWRHKDRYDPSRSLRAWVLGIANKRAIDHLRRQRRTAVPVEELDGIAGEDGRELAERYARASEVRDALSRLPDNQREVLKLAYFGDCTQTQIAAQLGVPLGTVKARTFRGLRRLGRLLASDDQPAREAVSAGTQGRGMTVDGQVVALAIRELRAMLPKTGGLLVPFQRVVEATKPVIGADGAGLTLAHEDHQPRWVATTDAAMELLEQIQHDFAEGPCLVAYGENRVVAVEDLRTARRWDRVAAVVEKLHVRAVLSVPVRLGSQPVGTLDVYATQPRAWSAEEVMALGAFATLTAELVHTGVELASRDAEVAQLRQALTSRIWVEQAKGVLAATQGVTPDEGFQQLRARARSSSRKLADLAQEVVQQAQRERVATLAIDDARVRAAEARAQAAEHALQAARTGLAKRTAALDRAQDDADARERAADQRDHLADERDRAADQRQRTAGRND